MHHRDKNPRSREAVNLVKEIYGDILEIPLNQVVKRLSELVVDGEFNDLGAPYNLFDDVREELSERGHDVAGSAVDDLINRFRHECGTGYFNDVIDFIKREYIAKQPATKSQGVFNQVHKKFTIITKKVATYVTQLLFSIYIKNI